MTNIQLDDLRNSGNRPDRIEGQAMTGMDFKAALACLSGRCNNALQLRIACRMIAFSRRIASRTGASSAACGRQRAASWGRVGRERAVAEFSWTGIAERTVRLYESLLS